MLTLNDIGNTGSASFEQPLDMLLACHDKIRRFCDQLDKLPGYITEHGVNEAVKNTIDGVIRYFDVTGPAHHIDEEEELFPILLERVPTAAPRIEQLEAEHGYLHSCWNAIRDDLRALRNGELDSISENAVAEFVRQYREHAASEEAWLIPTAAATLNAEELRNARLRMAQRRQQAC